MKLFSLAAWLLFAAANANAQPAVSVSPVKVTGFKAVVKLELKNKFAERVESARAVVFLTDEQGKVVGQATRWVIGGSQNKSGLESKATNSFQFVLTSDKPFTTFTTTNLTARVAFNRVILQGADQMTPARAW